MMMGWGACGWLRTVLLAVTAVVAAGLDNGAEAGPALVLDYQSGRVLYAEDPDQIWYPASLTKLMTAYLTFETVKSGKLTWISEVPLSKNARAQPATRIGLRKGIRLNVDQAVRGLIARSANDFAMALAEFIGGTERGFAELMNRKAQRLGMTRTHFENPHGLPNPKQVTTARDMGLLATAILKDFPEQAEIFSAPSFRIHRGTFYSHNAILKSLPGADGLKTGFTCGSGYNIIVSATREGRKIIAVVLGELSGAIRTRRATALIEHGFEVFAWKELFQAPKLAALSMSPVALVPATDLSRKTRTHVCGNPRWKRRVKKKASRKRVSANRSRRRRR